jgi:hypothetical protein
VPFGISTAMVAALIVEVAVISIVLWASGRALVGKEKAKFTDAIWITVLGLIVGAVVQNVIPFVGWLLALIIWLALIRYFFDTGWGRAILIALLAMIVFVVIAVVLRLLFGIVLLGFLGF